MEKETIKVPEKVKNIIDIAYENGEKAYMVGGCVRDSLLFATPKDFDITISSVPDKTKEIYKNFKTFDTGIKYGTVTVIDEKDFFEVTTFRSEDNYADFRHPEKITFSKNIEDDLSRRDFTINAMAYNHYEGLIDLFGGKNDLENKIIKCVGNPKDRFYEDPLRILRGIRFKSRLSFEIERETKKGMFEKYHLLKNISPERRKDEIEKFLIEGKENKKTLCEFEEIINLSLGTESLEIAKKHIENTKDYEVKWAILLADTKNTEKICKDLKFSKQLEKICCILKENRDRELNTLKDVRYLVKDWGILAEKIIEFKKALGQNVEKAVDFYERIKKENLCCSLKELAVKGDDLEKTGIKNKETYGKILNALLDMVIDEKVPNEKEKLTEKIKPLI